MAYVPESPSTYQGKQVIINSDRLLFNAKDDSILLFSDKAIGFSTNGSIHFDTSENKESKIVPINAMIVMILYVTAGFMAYMGIQTFFGIGLESGVGNQILSGIRGAHQFASASVIILLIIVMFGVLINVLYSAYLWLDNKIGIKNRK